MQALSPPSYAQQPFRSAFWAPTEEDLSRPGPANNTGISSFLLSRPRVGPIRDIGLLDSAVYRPRVSVFGRDAYPGLDDKAAVLLESLVRHQPLVDGNKRLGWLSVVVFYGLSNINLEAPDDDAYNLVIAVASGSTNYSEVATRLSRWH